MITSADNDKLKTIRKLQQKRWRTKLGLFSAEGEDLIRPGAEFILRSGIDVEPELLDAVSTLGSGSRVIGVYKQRWAEPAGDLLVYLHGVEDPGNVGTIIRSAHALGDATVVLGPGSADPYSPKAVRASMGSIFERPPARATLDDLDGHKIALDAACRTGASGGGGGPTIGAGPGIGARRAARRPPESAHPRARRLAERGDGRERGPLRGGK